MKANFLLFTNQNQISTFKRYNEYLKSCHFSISVRFYLLQDEAFDLTKHLSSGKFMIYRYIYPQCIIQIKTMNTFFRHKRTPTSQELPQQTGAHARGSLRTPYNHLSYSSVETIFPSSTQILKKKTVNQTEPKSKLTTSQVPKSKYSRFPREEDFLLKSLKKFSINQVQTFTPKGALQEKVPSEVLKRKMKKMDSLQCFPRARFAPHQDSKPMTFEIPETFPTSQVLQPVALRSPLPKETDSQKSVSESQLFNLKKLKETRSTVNLKESLSDIEKKEDLNCLELSFEIDQLLNGSVVEREAQDQKETSHALKELERLLDY